MVPDLAGLVVMWKRGTVWEFWWKIKLESRIINYALLLWIEFKIVEELIIERIKRCGKAISKLYPISVWG